MFGEDMDNILWLTFLGHPAYCCDKLDSLGPPPMRGNVLRIVCPLAGCHWRIK